MHALSINGLSKTYRNGVQALRNIDLDIEQGDYFALLGPNGAGKTTIISILTSLVRKTSGTVNILGHDIDHDFSKAKSLIGVVPQEMNFSIFETVEQVVVNQAGYYGVPHRLAKQRAEIYLKQLDLWGKRNEITRSLSGGMKRRLMIVRALLHEPKMLILDEPTAGVDVELRRSMWDFLQKINRQGTTIIMTTHYLEEAESQCRNLAIINRGEIIERAPIAEMLQKLDTESFILNLQQPVTEAPKIGDFDVTMIDNENIEVSISKGDGISAVFAELAKQDIHVRSMRNKANRLEELYLNITSKE